MSKAGFVVRSDLESGQPTFRYAHYTYTADQVRRDLRTRFERYKTAEALLARDQQILDAREKALAAREQTLDNMLNVKKDLETQVEQFRFVLDATQKILNEHPRIEPGTSRLRVTDFAGAAFELELFAYGKTGDWAEFTAIRQDVILKIAGIVEAAGTRFAAPTQLTYLSRDAGVDTEKADDIVRHGTELRANNASRFPKEGRTGTG